MIFLTKGELTDLRQALVNNKFFAHLAAKHEFHKFLSHLSKDIFDQLKIYLEDYKFYPPDVEYLGIDNVKRYLKSLENCE